MSSPELSRRAALQVGHEVLKAIFLPYGFGYDALRSMSEHELHVSPGTLLGVLLRLGGSAMPEGQLDFTPAFPAGEAAPYRAARKIEPYLTDYMSDEVGMTIPDRIAYLRMLKKETGIQSVRMEFRMNKLINPDGSFNEETRQSYRDSLIAVRETGLKPPTLVLFTPAPWMRELAGKNPQKFNELYERYVHEVIDICHEAGVTPKYLQVMNEVNTLL